MKLAILFPGQASQHVGMGRELCDEYAAVRELFSQADEVLGYALSQLIFAGPLEELTLTANAQPAILTASLAAWTVLAPFIPEGTELWMAGHSLGEYTALVAAGALDFAAAVCIVHLRGKFMQEAVPPGAGKMAAVVGLSAERISEVLAGLELGDEVVELANLNSPDQIVLSGSAAGVEAAAQALRDAGAKRVVELSVSAPFHSSLMMPAAEKLKRVLAETEFRPLNNPVLANVSAERYPQDATLYGELLYRQVFSPVRWMDTVLRLAAEKPDAFVEVGPGKVLRMLNARIAREVPCAGVSDIESFKKMLAYLTGETEQPGGK